MAPRQKEGAGITPLSFIVVVWTKYRKGLRQSNQPGARASQHQPRKDPAEVDGLYRDVGTSPQQQFSATLVREGERLLYWTDEYGHRQKIIWGAVWFHISFHGHRWSMESVKWDQATRTSTHYFAPKWRPLSATSQGNAHSLPHQSSKVSCASLLRGRVECHRGENQTIHDAKSWKIQLSFITYIKGDGTYSFKAQSLPGSESKVLDLPTCFQRNEKFQGKSLKISRGQDKCKPMKASVFSLDSVFHPFCLTAQYKL